MFFEHRRPHSQDLQEFAAEWEIRFEDARTSINKTGSTGDVFYGGYESASEHYDGWSGWSALAPEETETYWTDDWWPEDSWQSSGDDHYGEAIFYGEEEEWFEAEEQHWPEDSPPRAARRKRKSPLLRLRPRSMPRDPLDLHASCAGPNGTMPQTAP